ncbi:MAG TPA: alkaline phosphatase [Haliscomenobacter sp.]|uniref:alkaline phosphatase n=1 Tax=Haliscomenobacter sp. TaxID=2717303 RepID=UPI002B9476D4|nr:alkaline phosphatase [Haliscomenobacter sp.]HOY21232.1 alkaline phosphatase [Haliscomenobacter sp.]
MLKRLLQKISGKMLLLLGLTTVLWACGSAAPVESALPDKPKNIILMIGDGMGLSQISAAMYSNNNRLNIEQMPVLGFHKSYSYDDLVTDSAAGATAFACGIKTFNGAIGVDKDTLGVKTILEEAEENGLATGLIATSTIVHATPAAFIAHVVSREQYEEIASDMIKTQVDLLIGGGKKYFDRRENDSRNLYEEYQQKDYKVSDYSQEDMHDMRWDATSNLLYLTADKHPLNVGAGRDYLPYATRRSLEFLEKRSKDKGFFIMIEGSQIDWACHANDGKLAIKEALDFDRAIGEALNFARSRGNTLVIVTADHECGGMALNPGSKMNKIEPAFTTINHTASMIPVFAYGPMAKQFAGIFENTSIHKKMRQAFGFAETKTQTYRGSTSGGKNP